MLDSKNPLLHSGTFLAVATAFLYCVDAAYYEGYLIPLQLDANVLDRNFHQVLFNGFLVFLAPAFSALSVYVVARPLYSHAFLPSLNDWLRRRRERRRRFLKLKHLCLGKRKDPLIERREKQRTVTLFAYLATVIAFILSLAYSLNQGKKAGLELVEKTNNKPLQSSDLIIVKIDDQQRKLLYITCGARNCAGIDPVTKTVYYFPQNGHSYQYSAAVPKLVP